MRDQISDQILQELQEIKKEVSNVKGEQQKTNKRLRRTNEHLTRTNERLTSIESKQNIIYEQTGKLSEYHTETMSGFEHLATKDDLEYFDKKITEHDREIFKIKKRA